MRKFWLRYRFVIIALVLWRLALLGVELIASAMWPLRLQFTDPVRWANMDGGHYLLIARIGYGLYQQAFFPLYPVLLRLFSFLPVPLPYIGILISHVTLFFGMLLFYDVAHVIDKRNAFWSVVFLLVFPTSFFFAAVYPTSLYFFLSVATIWSIQRSRWALAGASGLLASATRIFGAFLVIPAVIEYLKAAKKIRLQDSLFISAIPAGLACYMAYLFVTTGDALDFAHVLPAFGTQRTANNIVLLPQVLWRYGKMLATADIRTVEYGVALLELLTFLFFVYLLARAFRTKLNLSYILYGAIVIFLPTLTGTLTSLPRYVLEAFPLFIVLGMAHNKPLKIVLAAAMFIGLVLCTSLYLQGYFIA